MPMALKTSHNTPASSPGLFSPSATRMVPHQTSLSESNSPAPDLTAPYLHPLQYKVRETHKALIDSDNITGRKLINQYEVIEEIGRGMHGKVKLARNLENGENVAIKIIPRFSKKRRLGKVTAKSPQDKTKKEIAILKKIRHPNVVALLEVIDDPELKKIYMVLEHAELGEVVWRKKGLPHICLYERRRVEREMSGEPRTAEDEKYEQLLERRQVLKELKRARMAQNYPGSTEYWSLEHGPADESGSSLGQQSRIPSKDDFGGSDGMSSSLPGSSMSSRVPSRSQSIASVYADYDDAIDWSDDMETPGPLRSNPNSAIGLDGTMYGAYMEDAMFRGRSPSMADSIISHMSSVDFSPQVHDTFADDFSYVPCFTLDQARATFRDTVLGLEYLHYQGVVHRDIKPANLLWSKDHRVKISDFGVSYFGRPIRDGEMDEFVSESEARDFDDDLELAKTVGTPAFFAPELCYTDLDREQPKVSEQIDVWSLGVTLYCLIYARIPFLAEDEFQMFKKIATEDVYIPRRRLKPVDPATSPSTTSLYKRHNVHPYRNDNDLEYEEVDGLLYELLRQMLIKNPEQRIRLRDIKRHPWVIQGLSNPIGWLDDTDPGRPSSGRRIQVDEREMSAAVVPITFLERARSVVKKAVGKVMNPLVERSDSKTRRRAASSIASSADDSMANAPPTLYHGDRRRSLAPDDYFINSTLNASLSQADGVPYDPLATVIPPDDLPREPSKAGASAEPVGLKFDRDSRSVKRTLNSPGLLSRRLSQQLSLHRGSPLFESHTVPSTPAGDTHLDDQGEYLLDGLRRARDLKSGEEDISRSRSVDRGLFSSADKRAAPQVGLNVAVAPGNIQTPGAHPRHPRPMRSVDLGRTANRHSLASPLGPNGYYTYNTASQGQVLDPSVGGSMQAAMEVRPWTAHHMESVPDAKSPAPRVYNNSTPESFAKAKEALHRRQELELRQSTASPGLVDPVNVPCPPSPDDEEWTEHPLGPSRGNTMTTVKSSSTDSLEAVGTPLTSPSEVTSPVSAHAPVKNVSDRMLTFQSDPSLPALLSESSSVSADMEAELLNRPGVVSTNPALLETTDSLTPPALMKEPNNGFPLDQVFGNPPAMESGQIRLHLSPSDPENMHRRDTRRRSHSDDDDDDDDGSDDGIVMMSNSKRKSMPPTSTARRVPFEARRRDTNISTTSVETAKPATYGAEGARSPNAH
jgi:serine/threonine protein kinase